MPAADVKPEIHVQWVTRQSHIGHLLVEVRTKGQALQATGQSHMVHLLVEVMTKGRVASHWAESHCPSLG